VLQGTHGLQPATWGEALGAIAAAAQGLGPNQFKAIAGKLADAESMVALKDLANRLGSGNIWHEGGFPDMSAGEGGLGIMVLGDGGGAESRACPCPEGGGVKLFGMSLGIWNRSLW